MHSLTKMVMVVMTVLGTSFSALSENVSEKNNEDQTYAVGAAIAELGVQVFDLSEIEKLHFLNGFENGMISDEMAFSDDVMYKVVEVFLDERENEFAISKRSEVMQDIVSNLTFTENFKTQITGFVLGYTLNNELTLSEIEAARLLDGVKNGFNDNDTRRNMTNYLQTAEQYMDEKSEQSDFAFMLHKRIVKAIIFSENV